MHAWSPCGLQEGCSTSTALRAQGLGLDTCAWYKAPLCQLQAWTSGLTHKEYNGFPTCWEGIIGTEIQYGEFSVFHSNRKAGTLETGDRH